MIPFLAFGNKKAEKDAKKPQN